MLTSEATAGPRSPGRPYLAAWSRLRGRLGEPLDIAGLVYFRIAFGAIMLWEMVRYIDYGWAQRYYTDHALYFKYWPFTFVEPLPAGLMEPLFYLVGLAALLFCIGLFYRVSAVALFIGLTYIFLLDQSRYLNHWYLMCLLSFVMIFVPAHRNFSLDARRNPSIRSETAPAWGLWLIRFQIAVPLFYGGLAKLNADWLRGEPLRDWISRETDFPLIGGLFTAEPAVWTMAYSALSFDLFIVPLLLRRQTRVFALVVAVLFHLMNARLWSIGIFPWLMIAATITYCDADWPRRIARDLRQLGRGWETRAMGFVAGAVGGFFLGGLLPGEFSWWRALIGALGAGVAGYYLAERSDPYEHGSSARNGGRAPLATPASALLLSLLGVWVTLQLLVPLRHFVVSGNVSWTEEGHRFAWHMKLRDKEAEARFFVTDRATGESWEIDNSEYLDSRQETKMSARPDMIVQFAHFLEDRWRDDGQPDVMVTAEVWASLNGREEQRLIDPAFDLTTARIPWLGHAEWILPLDEPLRRAGR